VGNFVGGVDLHAALPLKKDLNFLANFLSRFDIHARDQ